MLTIVLVIIAFMVLYVGAELTLWGAEKLGKALSLSPLLIGLLFVGFGTSLPELFVSHLAVFNQEPQMAIGNLLGSNIGNIFLILGITTLLVSLNLDDQHVFQQFS